MMPDRRKRFRARLALLLLAAVAGALTTPAPSRAVPLEGGLGELLKVFGIGWIVERFAGQINDSINGALRQHQAEIAGWTKVVPVVRVGRGGTAVGAAQVAGPREQVDKVEAVAEVEVPIAGAIRGRGLVPVTTREVTTVQGVGGVGVSAEIKFP